MAGRAFPPSLPVMGQEVLTVDGRDFPCQVLGYEGQREWRHVDAAGFEMFPGLVKVEKDGVIVRELIGIEAP